MNPYVEANAGSHWAHARGWPTGTQVTLIVDNPDNGNPVDYTVEATMGQAPWNTGDPNDYSSRLHTWEISNSNPVCF